MWLGGDRDEQREKRRYKLLYSVQHVSAKDTLSLCMMGCSNLPDVVIYLLNDALNVRVVERGRGGGLGMLHGAACRREGTEQCGGLGWMKKNGTVSKAALFSQ